MSFKKMLSETLDRVDGCQGLIFLDYEDEAVDWVCRDEDVYRVKFLGAHLGILMKHIRRVFKDLEEGDINQVAIKHDRSQLLARYIKDGYYLVIILDVDASTGRASYELDHLSELFKKQV